MSWRIVPTIIVSMHHPVYPFRVGDASVSPFDINQPNIQQEDDAMTKENETVGRASELLGSS